MLFFKKMNRTKKLYGSSLIVLSLIILFPQKTQAQYVDIAANVREYVVDPTFYALGTVALQKLTAQTVNWINSGFKGNPAYVTDPGQFFLDVGDQTASYFLSTNGVLNNLCSPFRAQVRLALVKNHLDDTQDFSCTLGTLEQNYNAFTNDFSQGGWDSWFNVSQNNQNNPYGSYLEAKNQLAYEIGTAKQNKRDQLQQGNGFLSFEKCVKYAPPEFVGPTEGLPSRQTVPGSSEENCIKKETVTPGSVISNSLNKALGGGLDKISAADEVGEIIGALLGQVVNKAISGLRGLTKSSSGQKSFADKLRDEPTRPLDNPNAGNVGGGQVTCSGSGGSSGTIDEFGNYIEVPESGGFNCTQTPVVIPEVVLPNTNPALCQAVTESEVMAILRTRTPSDASMQAASAELQVVYGSQVSVFGNAGDKIDKINFGGGMVVDVISDASGSNPTWSWGIVSACPSGSGGGGGGGRCADPGNTAENYASVVRNAEDAVLSNNPWLAASQNNFPAAEQFVNLVISQLKSMNYRAGHVLSGNGNPGKANKLAVWAPTDNVMERYEVVNHVGDGKAGETIRATAIAEYSGDIPLSCED